MVTVGMDSLGAISTSMTDINLCLCLLFLHGYKEKSF